MYNSASNGFAGAGAPSSGPVAEIDPAFERGGDAPGDLPSYTPTQAGQQLTRGGFSLNGTGVTGTAAVVTFAFRDTADTMPEDATGFSQFSDTQINATLQALQAWSDVANVTFVRVGGGTGESPYSNAATMLFGNYNDGVDGAAAFSYNPTDNANESTSSDVWINTSYAYETNPGLLNYGQQTLLHEIGHALGLQHPADYDASGDAPTYANDALYYEDSRQYTVMSYFGEGNTGADFIGYYASAPLMDDIAAAQRLYGANMTTRATNTTYGFNSTAGRAWFSAADGNTALIFCVWDAGGIDTFDFSGYAQDSLVDLRAGHFSSVGGLIGNVSIAAGVTIERAVGGTGADFIIGNASNNILGGGSGNDRLMGGGGDDTLAGSSGFDTADYSFETAAVTVNLTTNTASGATAGTDSLSNIEAAIGGLGNDNLTGNTVANLLDGGAGNDTLVGGLGDDTYGVDSLSDVITELAGEGTDTVAASITFGLSDANLENLTLTGAANIDGTGNAGANTLLGNNGNNRLDGGVGADTLVGGLGNDVLVVDNIADVVIERFNEGTDGVESSVTWSLGANLENLTLTGSAAIDGTGNGFDNLITGNSGVNILTGGAGNDVLDGGLGADSLVGGIGDDTYIVENNGDVIVEDTDEGNDTVLASRSFTLAANFENLVLTGSAANGFGNNTANWITGNAVANVMDGNGGDDVIDGGLGADTMTGGSGHDSFYVDNAGDVVNELAGDGNDSVISSVTFDLSGGFVENLFLTGTADLNGTGNALDNIISGTSGVNTLSGGDGNDTLDGGLGNDVMTGGLGNDIFVLDNAADVVVENAGEGNDTIMAAFTYNLTGTQIENLVLTGEAALNGTGNAFDNIIIGNTGANVLLGGAGNDTLNGGDTISGPIVDNGAVRHDTQATAMLIAPTAFSLDDNPFILDPTTIPHATIVASGDDTYRWYKFTARAGAIGVFDIDATIAIDTQIRLYDRKGNLLALADDSWDGEGAGGSNSGFDSFLRYTFNTSDTYYIEVSEYGHGPVLPGESYQLNISFDRNGSMFGNDTLDGGTGADVMAGGYGNDTYYVDNAGDVVVEAANSGSDFVQSTVSFAMGDYVEKLVLIGGNLNGTGNAQGNQITGTDGNNRLDGGGAADVLTGGKGNDTYIVDNHNDQVIEKDQEGTDLVLASDSFDASGGYVENITLTGTGNVDATGNGLVNILLGNNGNNALRGGGGNDSLTGGLGDDWLEGGSGADTMNGGIGNDTYVIDANDTFTDGGGIDTIVVGYNYVLGAGYENLTLGGTGHTSATGNSGVNILTGNSGNNTLDGAGGVDTMAGGRGDDTYLLDNVAETVTELRSEGIDTIVIAFSYTLSPTQYVDNLTLSGTANASATGNSLANILRGNAGNNKLDGLAGADTMYGGAGNDTYYVDNINDKAVETTDAGIDMVYASVSFVLGGNVENLQLTDITNINGTGNTLNNVIWGNDGANRLDGGAGIDKLFGGLGDDTYVTDNASDKAEDVAGGGIDLVISSASQILTAFVENLTLTGAANITATGNAMDNILIGNAGNNKLTGGLGADSMTGGAGHDTYYVDNAGDTVTEALNQGIDLVQSTVTFTLSDNVENLFLNGAGDLNGTGNAINNLITGTAGNNVLDGAGGVDKLFGGLGDDTYYLDNSSDSAKDEVDGGHDVVFSSAAWVMTAYVEDLFLTGAANISGTGNALNNILAGNDGNNKLDAGTGNDMLTGGLGADIFLFNAASGVDTITDFSAAQGDFISLKAYSHGVVNGGGIVISQNGADVLIDLGGGNTVAVQNVLTSDLNGHIYW